MGRYTDKLARTAGDYSYITITSDSSVLIEGCRQIIECSDVLAKVASRQFTVEIIGSGLTVDSFSNSNVKVSGRISSLSLEKRRRCDIK